MKGYLRENIRSFIMAGWLIVALYGQQNRRNWVHNEVLSFNFRLQVSIRA